MFFRFNSATGYSWEFKNKPAKISDDGSSEEDEASEYNNATSSNKKDEEDENPLNVRITAYQRQRTEMLLKNLVTMFPTEMVFFLFF